MRTPWPSRSVPQYCNASQIEGNPNASPAWIVKWKFSRRRYSNASRWRLGGNPASAPGDVETDDAAITMTHGQLGDLARTGRMAHRGEDRADADRSPALGRLELTFTEPGHGGLDHLVQAQAAFQVLLRRPADLGVDHAVVAEVLDGLPCHPAQALGRLHDPDRVGERFQVTHQRTRRRRLVEPPGQLGRVRASAGRCNRCVRPARRPSGGASPRPDGRAARPWGPSGSPPGSGRGHSSTVTAAAFGRLPRIAGSADHNRRDLGGRGQEHAPRTPVAAVQARTGHDGVGGECRPTGWRRSCRRR